MFTIVGWGLVILGGIVILICIYTAYIVTLTGPKDDPNKVDKYI